MPHYLWLSFLFFLFLFVLGLFLFFVGLFLSLVAVIKWQDETKRKINWSFAAATISAFTSALLLAFSIYGMVSSAQPVQSSESSDNGILASWVQVVPQDGNCVGDESIDDAQKSPPARNCAPTFSIRAVAKSARGCPELPIIDDKPVPQKWGFRYPGPGRRGNFNNIVVCEIRLLATPKTIKFPGQESIFIRWDLGGSGPTKIVLFGDTGCRGMRVPVSQPCGQEWTFRSIAESAANLGPGLVIHLGDYLYEAADDDWEDWSRYFFEPAKTLLRTAPFIFVRGNHENCLTANQWSGFELFFGDKFSKECERGFAPAVYEHEFDKPYAIDLTQHYRLIVADSSGAFVVNDDKGPVLDTNCFEKSLISPITKAAKIASRTCEKIVKSFQYIQKLALSDGQNWLATQVPVFAVEKFNSFPTADANDIPGPSTMMLAAWNQVFSSSSPVERIFSGDLHLMQVIGPQSSPKQITIGTGGVGLDLMPEPKPTPGDTLYEFDMDYRLFGAVSRVVKAKDGCSDRRNGYLLVELDKLTPKFTFNPLSPSGTGCKL